MHFVNAFGPYYDAESLLLQAASRSVVYELIDTLDNPMDIEILARHYDTEKPTALKELDGLSPPGRRVAQLLAGVEPTEGVSLAAALPSGFHEDLDRISPSSHVSDLKARLLVMHDRDDLLVPAAESRRLLEATRDRGNVRLRAVRGRA